MKQFSAARKKLQSTLRKHVVNVMVQVQNLEHLLKNVQNVVDVDSTLAITDTFRNNAVSNNLS